jgi:hypothetical protein
MSADVAHLVATTGLTLALGAVAIGTAVWVCMLLIRALRPLDAAEPARTPPTGAEGGGGSRQPQLPADESDGDGEPEWWPDFERKLAAWSAKRPTTGPGRAL